MYPNQGLPVWSGAVKWRGTSLASPFLSRASMILARNNKQRFVGYPISKPDPESSLAKINWIAEKSLESPVKIAKVDWTREVSKSRFLSGFESWVFDWLNVPDIIRTAENVFEHPIVDREPVNHWTDRSTTLIGDAAHATYPVSSSSASQTIMDAILLGAKILKHGLNIKALEAYENIARPMANNSTLANRNRARPDAIIQMVEDRCGDDFSKLDQSPSLKECADHALSLKKLAGLKVEDINNRMPIITFS